MNKFLLIPILLFSLASCQKEGDHLEGDYAILVGSWEWYHTYGYGGTNIQGFYDLTPANYGSNFKIEFEKEGRFKTYVDGELEHEGYLDHNCNGAFTLHGKDYEVYNAFLELQSDTIHLSSLPFDQSNIWNYFSRSE